MTQAARVTSKRLVAIKVEANKDDISDVSESLDNSSQLSELDENDPMSELALLKADLDIKNWILEYELKEI